MQGTWKEGSLAWDPVGYVEKALEAVISFNRVPMWGNWRRVHLPGDFKRWMKWARWRKCLSL